MSSAESSADQPKRRWYQRQFQQWVARKLPPTEQITLHLRNVYILPSRHGLLYLLATALVFLAAINYAISLAFGLAFMMASIFVVTIIHSFNNLNRLSISALPTQPVFCGEDASFQVLLSRQAQQRHEALEIGFAQGQVSRADLLDTDQQTVSVYIGTSRRGLLQAPPLRIITRYPLGLTRAWSMVNLKLSCLVYPRPIPVSISQLPQVRAGSGSSVVTRDGSEDFYGLRNYVTGDSMKQVAWKNVARGQGLQVKQFAEYVDDRIWLDWDMFYGFGAEGRLKP